MTAVAAQKPIRLHADFDRRALARAADAQWTPSPGSGVERRMLERIGGEVARSTSVVRYAPGAAFSAHLHAGGEEFLVLDGVFSDEGGDFPAGTYVRNPPGSRHAPRSQPGCTIFVKLWQMHPQDRASLRLDTGTHPWIASGAALSRMPLYAGRGESVELQRWSPGAELGEIAAVGGREIFMLEGGFADEDGEYETGDWLRLPPGAWHTPRTATGCMLYLRTGHLIDPAPLPAT